MEQLSYIEGKRAPPPLTALGPGNDPKLQI